MQNINWDLYFCRLFRDFIVAGITADLMPEAKGVPVFIAQDFEETVKRPRVVIEVANEDTPNAEVWRGTFGVRLEYERSGEKMNADQAEQALRAIRKRLADVEAFKASLADLPPDQYGWQPVVFHVGAGAFTQQIDDDAKSFVTIGFAFIFSAVVNQV